MTNERIFALATQRKIVLCRNRQCKRYGKYLSVYNGGHLYESEPPGFEFAHVRVEHFTCKSYENVPLLGVQVQDRKFHSNV